MSVTAQPVYLGPTQFEPGAEPNPATYELYVTEGGKILTDVKGIAFTTADNTVDIIIKDEADNIISIVYGILLPRDGSKAECDCAYDA